MDGSYERAVQRTGRDREALALSLFLSKSIRRGRDIFDPSFGDDLIESGFFPYRSSRSTTPPFHDILGRLAGFVSSWGQEKDTSWEGGDFFFYAMKEMLRALDERSREAGKDPTFNAFRMAGECVCWQSVQPKEFKTPPAVRGWLGKALKSGRIEAERQEMFTLLEKKLAAKTGADAGPGESFVWGEDDGELYLFTRRFIEHSFALYPQDTWKLIAGHSLVPRAGFLFAPPPKGCGNIPPGTLIPLLGGEDELVLDGKTSPLEAACRILFLWGVGKIDLPTLDGKISGDDGAPLREAVEKTAQYVCERFSLSSESEPTKEFEEAVLDPSCYVHFDPDDLKEKMYNGTAAEFLSLCIRRDTSKKRQVAALDLLSRKDLWADVFRDRIGLSPLASPARGGGMNVLNTDPAVLARNLGGATPFKHMVISYNMPPADALCVMFNLGTAAEEVLDLFEKEKEEAVASGTTMTGLRRTLCRFLPSRGAGGTDIDKIKSCLLEYETALDVVVALHNPFPSDPEWFRTFNSLRLGKKGGLDFWMDRNFRHALLKTTSTGKYLSGAFLDDAVSKHKIHELPGFWERMRDTFIPPKDGFTREDNGENPRERRVKLHALQEKYLEIFFRTATLAPGSITETALGSRLLFSVSSPEGDLPDPITVGEFDPLIHILFCDGKEPEVPPAYSAPDKGPVLRIDAGKLRSRGMEELTVPVWMILSAAGSVPPVPETAIMPMDQEDVRNIRNGVIRGDFLPAPEDVFEHRNNTGRLTLDCLDSANPLRLYEHWVEKEIAGTGSGMYLSHPYSRKIDWTRGMMNNRGEKIARRGMLSPEIILHLASRRRVLEENLIHPEEYAGQCGAALARLFFSTSENTLPLWEAVSAGIWGMNEVFDRIRDGYLGRDAIYSSFFPFADAFLTIAADTAARIGGALSANLIPDNVKKEYSDVKAKTEEMTGNYAGLCAYVGTTDGMNDTPLDGAIF